MSKSYADQWSHKVSIIRLGGSIYQVETNQARTQQFRHVGQGLCRSEGDVLGQGIRRARSKPTDPLSHT